MAIVLIGIISIQFYWIKNAVSLRQEEFSRNVQDALGEVVSILEKEEAVSKLRSHKQGRMLFLKTDSLDLNNIPDSLTEFTAFKQFERKGENVIIDYVEEAEGKQIESHVAVEELEVFDDSLVKGFNFESIDENDRFLENDIRLELDSLVKKRLINKTILISDIVKSLMEVNLNEPIDERVDVKELDSLLGQSFESKGINTRFEFGIFSASGGLVITSAESGKYELLNEEYTARLFPDDIIQEANYLNVHFPHQTGFVLKNMSAMLTTSGFFVIGIILIFFYAINTIIRQKQLSEIKNDFINNMTHELKTPISTISLACEALSDKDIAKNDTLLTRYVGMIKEENHRLGVQVENVLQSAVWDKGDFKLDKQTIDLNQLILSVVNKVGLQVKEKQGIIETALCSTNPVISGDKVHLTNVIYNLVDNANKYSHAQPEIKLATKDQNNYVEISVQDNGIGISKENQKKIFDKLYRVPTGNVHDVKGFGLGLNYVKIIVDRHQGKIELDSTLGKGSTFKIYLPKSN